MPSIDKVVILARGRGTRMRARDDHSQLDARQAAVADTGVKAMIPVANRPFLDYVLSGVADAGYRRVCLVVGPDQQATRDYYGRDVALRRLRIEFAVQEQALGTANALLSAADFAGRDPFVLLNSDNFYPPEALDRLKQQTGAAVALFEREAMLADSNITADRIASFAVGDIDAAGRLRRIIEKPDAQTLAQLPSPQWVSMNCWRFGPPIFEACRAIPRSQRGEYELTMAVQHAIDELGEPFQAVLVRAPVLDLTSRGDIAKIEARLRTMEVQL